jgi:hypothetical protein
MLGETRPGQIVSLQRKEAYLWLERAVAHGVPEAESDLAELTSSHQP